MTAGALPDAEAPAGAIAEARVMSAPSAGAQHRVPLLVSSIEGTVERTVARWRELSLDPADLDWSPVLVGALQHRVEGLCLDALRDAGWHELVPPSVLHALERRALLAEARFLAHYHALQELRDHDEELVASLVLLNGAALVGAYQGMGHRMLGDVDLLVDDGHVDRLAARARELGYWEKEGASRPTFYKDVEAAAPGAGYVALDVHTAASSSRDTGPGLDPAALRRSGGLVPHAIGDVASQRPGTVPELVYLLVRLHDHAASLSRWAMEDDVRLVRVLDVELRAADLDDAADVLAHARAVGVTARMALGLAVVQAIRGALPERLAGLTAYARAVEPCTHLLALPAGRVVRVGEPLAARAWSVDKSARARALVGDARRSRDWWSHWRRPGAGDESARAQIAARADERLRAAGLVPA